MRAAFAFLLGTLAACNPQPANTGAEMDLPRGVVRSGYEFLQPETRILQDDDFENPGLLWVQQGAVLFETPMQGGPACASCHGEGGRLLTGAAAHYPAMESQSGELVNLEGRINLCRERYQGAPALAYESSELLALTAYTASLARGMEQSVNITGAAAPYYDAGRAYFFARKGQYNLSCHQCHDENWGRQLRGDTISQGHGNAFPAYRLEWQDFGSLHRRLRDCDSGIRAEPLPYGSETYVAVELYLAKRAEGLVMESPGVRR